MLTKIIRPYVILNVAITADGKTDTINRKGASISSDEDMRRVDQLRADMDAIMIGGRTLLDNDPRLTVKSEQLRKERIERGVSPNPIKIGVVTKADLKPDSRFLTAGPAQIMIFTTQQTDPEKIDWLLAQGIKAFIMGEKRVELKAVMQQLWQEGIRRLLVEGGGTLNDELLRLGLVDDICIFIGPMIFGGGNAPTFVDGYGLSQDTAIQLRLLEYDRMDDGGILLHYQPLYEENM
jgi:2,5-diamino-6-(ribosylamino)-4(3H)-pyrimidinone 5'-phosphate reductase